MTLKEIFGDLGADVTGDAEILGITNDSRKVKPGDLFFAVTGLKDDGNAYILSAIANGAAAIATGKPVPAELISAHPRTAWVRAADLPAAFSKASDRFYGRPSRRFTLIGITGTNGKTTTAYLLETIYALAGARPGVIGTIDYRVDGKVLAKAANTTPTAADLHSLFRTMADAGADAVVMEVSSHALALKRADEAAFDVALFTNLQRDHLDFHKDRETYFNAKLRLFELLAASPKKNKSAVVNADEEKAGAIVSALSCGVAPVTYGIDKPADFRASEIKILQDRTVFELNARGTRRKVTLRLLGRYNVYNALAAVAAAVSAGVPLETAVKGAETLASVPGRLERVDLGQTFGVFVDYAHTDAALENVLTNLGRMPHGRIITVFGYGGDRDRTKRAPMAEAAARLSDHAILTSDNPRGEDPARIFADMEAGLKGAFANYTLLPDRKTAIMKAVELARAGDIVLIAGKGHEDYQILKDRTIHFDDREAAAEAIKEKTKNRGL
ncbi:MAG: UDP-N-acetylmuramoyl-L-alanyl-D-glutamate--2,6-diaminopimelate ligase [Elusimicrobiales bacterium]